MHVRDYTDTLKKIREIVYTPTKDTPYRTAERHFQADFDAIRKLIDEALS